MSQSRNKSSKDSGLKTFGASNQYNQIILNFLKLFIKAISTLIHWKTNCLFTLNLLRAHTFNREHKNIILDSISLYARVQKKGAKKDNFMSNTQPSLPLSMCTQLEYGSKSVFHVIKRNKTFLSENIFFSY